MSKTIVCATDFSPAADQAAELAFRLPASSAIASRWSTGSTARPSFIPSW
jgi:hypothetical protein